MEAEQMSEETLEKLHRWVVRFDEIINLIDNREQIPFQSERESARASLRALKTDLVEEARRLREEEGSLNPIEVAFYLPAVRKAEADLTTPPDSVPGREWYGQLFWARGDIDFQAIRLKALSDEELDATLAGI